MGLLFVHFFPFQFSLADNEFNYSNPFL